jgi:hypothetical protein
MLRLYKLYKCNKNIYQNIDWYLNTSNIYQNISLYQYLSDL